MLSVVTVCSIAVVNKDVSIGMVHIGYCIGKQSGRQEICCFSFLIFLTFSFKFYYSPCNMAEKLKKILF